MTLAFIVLTVAVVPAAWNFRKSYKKINDVVDKVYADINPITHHLSRIADNLDYITTSIRADVQKASLTVEPGERAAGRDDGAGRGPGARVQRAHRGGAGGGGVDVRVGRGDGPRHARGRRDVPRRRDRGAVAASAPESDEDLNDELDALDDLYGMRAVRDTDEEDADGDDIGRGLGRRAAAAGPPAVRRVGGGGADREQEFDLLTAALLGAALGAGVALLVGGAAWREPRRSGVQQVIRGVRQSGRELGAGPRRGSRARRASAGAAGEPARVRGERARAPSTTR
jgi:hypothetical protein